MINKTINLSPKTHRRLQRYAKLRNTSVESLTNALLKLALDNKDWVNLISALAAKPDQHSWVANNEVPIL
jgi:hypothetical protein